MISFEIWNYDSPHHVGLRRNNGQEQSVNLPVARHLRHTEANKESDKKNINSVFALLTYLSPCALPHARRRARNRRHFPETMASAQASRSNESAQQQQQHGQEYEEVDCFQASTNRTTAKTKRAPGFAASVRCSLPLFPLVLRRPPSSFHVFQVHIYHLSLPRINDSLTDPLLFGGQTSEARKIRNPAKVHRRDPSLWGAAYVTLHPFLLQ